MIKEKLNKGFRTKLYFILQMLIIFILIYGCGPKTNTENQTTETTKEDVSQTEESTTEPETEAPEEFVPAESLKDAFSKYFSIGAAVTPAQLQDAETLEHIKEHYNSITMENIMKPQYILGYSPRLIAKEDAEFPVPDSYTESEVPELNFNEVDIVLDIAKENGLTMRGHTLVWHSQTPSWFFYEGYDTSNDLVSIEVMNERMEYYIQQVLQHVQSRASGVIYAWDVVNEMFADDGSLRKAGTNAGAGESMWMSIYGSDEFAYKAFEYADKYREEGVKLFYNDYNEYIPGKRDAIYNFAVLLNAKGHIDGIGMQSHLDVSYPDIDTISQAINKFNLISKNIEIQLTEVDVTINFGKDNGSTLEDQTKYYEALTKLLISRAKMGIKITNVTFWGLYDEVSWRAQYEPLLFNDGFVPKDAYTIIIDTANELSK